MPLPGERKWCLWLNQQQSFYAKPIVANVGFFLLCQATNGNILQLPNLDIEQKLKERIYDAHHMRKLI